MIYRLHTLQHWQTEREIQPGVWVPARPLDGPFLWRLTAAWEVLRGRADAFTWPEQEPPEGQGRDQGEEGR